MAVAIIVIVCVVLLIGVDIWLVADGVDGNTFSELLREGARTTTFFPWALALLGGRWFHPVPELEPVIGPASIAVVMILSWVVVVVGDIMLKKKKQIPSWIIVVTGLVVGALFVPAPFTPA